ncbi:hypothetical protein EW145_g2308 [Phellinidium pouzarii]|uniref:Cupin type-1 domain-containing protein n=1 Tax=Phellinidium pouzarii TaxID=167371 RepID=A0A4S4LBE2_9AGAM|nr:hypothetical protein EW145_g2308 [Phellinidium pouzarii]
MFRARLLYCLILASVSTAAPTVNNSTLSVAASPAISSVSGSISSALSSSVSIVASSTDVSATSGVASVAPAFETAGAASDLPNDPAFQQGSDVTPEAISGGLGATLIAPDDTVIDQQNPDILAPPTTDAGTVGQAMWPFALSHNRLQSGGWARQQNVDVMPFATAMASVNMRLEAGAIRELHWHSTAEGSTVVTAVNTDGQVFADTVETGDLWYFPPGIPHSLQATDDDPDGTEFLLVFDDGSFSEDDTFLLTDWTAHLPKEVLAKNFQLDISAFDHIPAKELYIFPSTPPPDNEQPPSSPAGTVPNPFTFKLSQAPATPLAGGSMKVFDPSVFPIATTIVGTLVTVEPGGMRRWHPTQPEWSYFISGQARMTLYAASQNARTFDFQVGEIGYVPPSFGHFVENTGNTTLQFLELFNSDVVEDVSMQQWLALTPPALVKAHLGFDDATIAALNKTKQFVVGPSSS